MADSRRYGLVNQFCLDIDEILQEAQHRWLRPVEICEILRNFKKFRIFPEPAIMPPSGSLFLYDRKVLRYFRKDGHSWRKKKDGKTVKEAHERLKAGSVDVLHCYYAHGEENENFQRRSYWMLEEDLSHIVLVHYREVEGNRMDFNRIIYSQGTEEPNSEIDSSVSSSVHQTNCQMRAQTTETSLNRAQASEQEDDESECSQQASSRFHSFLELQKPVTERVSSGFPDPYCSMLSSNDYQEKFPVTIGEDLSSLTPADRTEDCNGSGVSYKPQKNISFLLSDNILESSTAGIQSMHLQSSFISSQHSTKEFIPKQGHGDLGQIFNDTRCNGWESRPHVHEEWQRSTETSSHAPKWDMDQNSNSDLVYNIASVQLNHADLLNPTSVETNLEMEISQSMQNELLRQFPNAQHDFNLKPISESDGTTVEAKALSPIKQSLLDATSAEGLKKNDSFNRWMSKELGDVTESSHMQSTSGSYWDPVESENVVDGSSNRQAHLETYLLSPSLSHDQLFSIIDFSPNWVYEGSEIKVLVTGRFLKGREEAEECKWSCMFGEVEVPAEVIANGVLRCHTPPHMAGRVPFYITCSNRLACSEVREFEYRDNCVQHVYPTNNHAAATTEAFEMRLGKFLCLSSTCPPNPDVIIKNDKARLFSKISQLLTDDNNEWEQMSELILEANFSLEKVQHRLVQKLLKEKLLAWLLQKATEGGKGPSILDEGGQGVIHFSAALGYDWAFLPSTIAGINVNFRDVNGWTALHWAAFCGRERTVATLISLGAFPGALTDPSPKSPSGQAPADLASINGHKGISGYLAESALSSHLSSLNLDKQEGSSAEMPESKVVRTTAEKNATPDGGDLWELDRLSLKDSLAAVCNATQAAARIHQVFRLQSFQRRQRKELDCRDDNKLGMLEERALSLILINKPSKLGGVHDDEPMHAAAAIRIQNKFRSWKGRKDFLIIRQRIVKIQAHVRGHQVRKSYRKITWSVGILEKVILRWRRKGSGLRGFKSEALSEGPKRSSDARLTKEDDDDFLREGRKQTEERLNKALARVKSMVQYPEARIQYRRLLNVSAEIQETKFVCEEAADSSCEGTTDYDDLIDIEALLDEDTLMPTASD